MSSKLTFVVEFGEGTKSQPGVVVELEPSLNLNAEGEEGKTSFEPGDIAYFVVHTPSNLVVKSVVPTSGDVGYLYTSTFKRENQGAFFTSNDTTIDLQHTPSSTVSVFWFGRTGHLKRDGQTLSVTNAPCIGDVTYSMSARLYKHTPPAESSMTMNKERYLVGIVVTVEEG